MRFDQARLRSIVLLGLVFAGIPTAACGGATTQDRSGLAAGSWGSFWLYIISPVAGMLLSAYLFRSWYFNKKGECKTMNCFMNGQQVNNKAYHVYSWFQKNEKGNAAKVYAPENKP